MIKNNKIFKIINNKNKKFNNIMFKVDKMIKQRINQQFYYQLKEVNELI